MQRYSVKLLALTLPLAMSPLVMLPASASAASRTLVISEAYGGGGNTGSTHTHDFVELFNRGAQPVDLHGWSLQYWSATGDRPALTQLSGQIAPGRHFLVQQAAGRTDDNGRPLPTPDAVGRIAISATGGRIAVVDPHGQIVDLLGWGAKTQGAEGRPAPTTTNATSVSRRHVCTDTDDNAVDFHRTVPSPLNSSAPSVSCRATPVPRPPVSPTPGKPTNPAPSQPGKTALSIAQIQGGTHVSPYAGKGVANVPGIVTALNKRGFWMQSARSANNPAASDGIYVFTHQAPGVKVGDAVEVTGKVNEFRPKNAPRNLSTTQLAASTVRTLSSGNELPPPVVIGVDRIAPAQSVYSGNVGDLDKANPPLRPQSNALDFYESLEGMRVTVRDARVVGATTSYGEMVVVPGQAKGQVDSARGGVVYSGYDKPNSARVHLKGSLLPSNSMPKANVNDTLPGEVTGVMDYDFGVPKILLTGQPEVRSGGLQRESTTPASPDEVAVSTFNVENLSMSSPQEKFDRLAAQIVANLHSPDVVALEEIQDDSGPADDGTVTSTRTVQRLADAVKAQGGPEYRGLWIDPQNNVDGGKPGGNIRQVFFYRADRGLAPAPGQAGDAVTSVGIVSGEDGQPHLTHNPGRIAPADKAWSRSRKPLAAEFRIKDKSLIVIANHFGSKGGDDPQFGRVQQPQRRSESSRHAQARLVRGFVDKLVSGRPDARVVVLGDMNDFEYSQTARILEGQGEGALLSLTKTLPVNDRYSYIFQGNSQILDQILVSRGLQKTAGQVPALAYDIVHTNSEFADQDSDHDPQVVRLNTRGW
ncbi:lamin tail domain-containing protein [Austwickia chelonae]|uniref:lamin tail domain-containing protein n=1 Tax=Austwickia chelonae TaxID=100225 RepID=UPI000E22AAFE|nr:lamin tail domain-containing protein [Austwickia chelonae]